AHWHRPTRQRHCRTDILIGGPTGQVLDLVVVVRGAECNLVFITLHERLEPSGLYRPLRHRNCTVKSVVVHLGFHLWYGDPHQDDANRHYKKKLHKRISPSMTEPSALH